MDEQLERLTKAVALIFEVHPDDIGGRSHRKPVREARNAFVWYAHERLGFSHNAIARMLGRDHTTIISSRRRAHDLAKRAYTGFAVKYFEVCRTMECD